MMMACDDGDLVHEIRTQMLTNQLTITKFNDICNKDEKLSGDGEETEQVIKYIVERYTNMRGTYFVKFLKGIGNGSVDRLVDSQATRAKVANSVARTKAVADTKSEGDENEIRLLWKNAEENATESVENDILV